MNVKEWISHLTESVTKAQHWQSKIGTDWTVLDQPGLSGKRERHLLNNICSAPSVSYLEIGTFRGSTVTSVLYHNDLVKCVGIDNFSYNPYEQVPKWDDYCAKQKAAFELKQAQGKIAADKAYSPDDTGWANVRIGLKDNLERLKMQDRLTFIEQDFLKVDVAALPGPFNVVFYDGPFNALAVSKFVPLYLPSFEKLFVLVVGGFNATSEVETPIEQSLKAKKIHIHHKTVLRSSSATDSDNWWGGLGIYLLQKVA